MTQARAHTHAHTHTPAHLIVSRAHTPCRLHPHPHPHPVGGEQALILWGPTGPSLPLGRSLSKAGLGLANPGLLMTLRRHPSAPGNPSGLGSSSALTLPPSLKQVRSQTLSTVRSLSLTVGTLCEAPPGAFCVRLAQGTGFPSPYLWAGTPNWGGGLFGIRAGVGGGVLGPLVGRLPLGGRGGEQAWVRDEVGGGQREKVAWRARPDDPFPCFAPHRGPGVRSQACECGWKRNAGW